MAAAGIGIEMPPGLVVLITVPELGGGGGSSSSRHTMLKSPVKYDKIIRSTDTYSISKITKELPILHDIIME